MSTHPDNWRRPIAAAYGLLVGLAPALDQAPETVRAGVIEARLLLLGVLAEKQPLT